MNRSRQVRCEACGELTPAHEIISVGGAGRAYRELCGQRFNAEVASLNGLDNFESFRIEPIRLVDCAGKPHEFHFRTHLLGHIVVMDAYALSDGDPSGYHLGAVRPHACNLRGLAVQAPYHRS